MVLVTVSLDHPLSLPAVVYFFQTSAPYSIELCVGAPNLTNIRYAEGEMVKNALQMLTVMA